MNKFVSQKYKKATSLTKQPSVPGFTRQKCDKFDKRVVPASKLRIEEEEDEQAF